MGPWAPGVASPSASDFSASPPGDLTLGKGCSQFQFSRLANTHAKILIWDAEMVVTSFNWLSFRGDSGRKYRQEEGTLIRHRDYVDVEYERHRARIESTTS